MVCFINIYIIQVFKGVVMNEYKIISVGKKSIAESKYDFKFKNYHQLVLTNNGIVASYLIGDWCSININLTKLFEDGKFEFEILKPYEANKYHCIVFENNHIVNEFVDTHKTYWGGNENTTIENLLIILMSIDHKLTQYFEPIILNYFVNTMV